MDLRDRMRFVRVAPLMFLVVTAVSVRTAHAAAPSRGTATSAACGSSLTHCDLVMLKWINQTRIHYGLQPLKLQTGQSQGTAYCAGAYGHSIAMSRTGYVWHINGSYPQASFPQDICVSYTHAGENVGQAPGANILHDLHLLHHMMMAQPHDRTTCATIENHACNILSPAFRRVGIGIYYAHGRAWLTENFLG